MNVRSETTRPTKKDDLYLRDDPEPDDVDEQDEPEQDVDEPHRRHVEEDSGVLGEAGRRNEQRRPRDEGIVNGTRNPQ